MGYVPWDYSHAWGNFQGRIAPAYTLRFVVLGLIALYALYPAVGRFASTRPVTAQRLALALVVANPLICHITYLQISANLLIYGDETRN